MDPQQRHLLEVTWEAFEDAGIVPGNLKEECGVFVGVGMMDHAIQLTDTSVTDAYTLTGIAHSVASNRISYCFDFKGPSFSVDTACAAGLTAMHLACNSLHNKECKVAVVSSCNHIGLPDITVAFSALGVLSPDGRCSPFSESANGYVRSEGWNSLILKPLDQAVADGDHIYTVIKGSLIADNGNSSSLTMPSVPAMEYVMTETYKKFGVPMSRVNFVEAHGTGTPVGDPMEAEAIGKSFAPKRNTPLKFGSIKGNFGHTEIAAGTASAIKIALMMENRMLVPTINFVKPNHMIDMDAWKLNLLTEAEPFSDEKYIIGLNSFGFAGALAHCIFEEPPKIKQREPSSSCGWHFGEDSKEGKAILVPLSAKSPEAVVAVARQWSDFENERDALGVVSWLATHRTHFDYRMSVIANSGQQFRNQLHDFIESGSSDKVLTTTVYSNEKPKVCLIFPGQGQQWVDMGRQLYQTEEIFKNVIDACDAIFEEISGWSLLRDRRLFVKATEGEVVGKEVFNDLEVSQPAILFLQIAYFRLLEYWGVVPDAIVGHSLGEVAAAYAAGGLTLEEAILVIYIRSVEQGKLKGTGSMAALRMNSDEATILCSKYQRLYIAAYNAPGSVTIAGNSEAIDEICSENPTIAKKLRVSCAFHTPDMDSTEKTFKEKMKSAVRTPANVRNTPVYSTTNGERHEGDFGMDYWWSNIRNAVKFQQAVESILSEVHPTVFIECAASMTLLSSINAIAKGAGGTAQLTTIAMGQRHQDDRLSALRALHGFHTASIPINWANVTCDSAPWISLPSYPWQHVTSLTEPEYRRKRRLGLDDRTYKGQNGELTFEMFPYLNDYVVNNALTFPVAGLLAYGMEMSSEKYPLEIRGIEFPEKANWKEVKTSTGSKKKEMKLQCVTKDDKITISDDEATYMCAQISTGEASTDKKTQDRLAGAKRRCEKPVSKEEIYQLLESSGNSIGLKFQVIEEAMVGDGEVIATVRCQGDKQGSVTTMLDSCFQVLSFLMASESTSFQASAVQCLTMHLPTLPHDDHVTLIGRITDCDNEKLVGNVIMTSSTGEDVLVELTGCLFRNVAIATRDITVDQCLFETSYQPTKAVLPPTSVIVDIFSPENLSILFPDVMESIGRGEKYFYMLRSICDAYIRHGLETVSETERKKSDARYLKRLCNIANATDVSRIAYDDIYSKMDELLSHVPEYAQEVSMIKSLGDHFPTTLRDPQSAMTKLFKPECMAAYFMESLTTRLYYMGGAEIIVEALKTALSQKKVVRILEVGARMGGLTRHILQKIKPLCEQGRVEYIFTDLSVAFFPHARENLEEFPFVKYQQLDIEQDVEGQGFVPSSIDILICLDTLHSTADLYEGVFHMRNLVADDGWFILYEATRATYIAELLFGALRLCWLMEDFRTECCWMDEQSWVDIVANCGFTEVVAVSSPKNLFHSIIVGKKTGGYEGFPFKPIEHTPGKQWVIITEKEQSRITTTIEGTVRKPRNFERMTYSEMKTRKSIVNGIKQPTGKAECVFLCNKCDNHVENLLRYLEYIEKESEHVSRAWVVFASTAEEDSRDASLVASIVRSASNHISCPTFLVQTTGKDKDIRLLSEIFQKQQVPHREILVIDGEVTEPKLIKRNAPEASVKVTPWWELQLQRGDICDDNVRLSFSSWSPEVNSDQVLVKLKGADLTQFSSPKGSGIADNTDHAARVPCAGIVLQVGEDVNAVQPMDEVFILSPQNISSHLIASPFSVIKKPKSLSWSECVSSVLPFSLAYYCLIERARLSRGERLLVHSLHSTISLASIQIGRLVGADVTIYVGTKDEAQIFLNIEGVTVFVNEATADSDNGIKHVEHGTKFDVVLTQDQSNLPIEKHDVLFPGGRICHIKNSRKKGSAKPKLTTSGNTSHLFVDFYQMLHDQPVIFKHLLEKVSELFSEGIFAPLKAFSFPVDHIDKVINEILEHKYTAVTVDIPPAVSFPLDKLPCTQTLFQPNICYIVNGSQGGVGQALSRWLCTNGARHIAMVTHDNTREPALSRTKDFLQRQKCSVYLYRCSASNPIKNVIENLRNKLQQSTNFGLFHTVGYDAEKIKFSDLTFNNLNGVKSSCVTPLEDCIKAIGESSLELLITIRPDGSIWGSTTDVASGIIEGFFTDRVRRLKNSGKAAVDVQVSQLHSVNVYEEFTTGEVGSEENDVADAKDGLNCDEFLAVLEKIILNTEHLPASVCLEQRVSSIFDHHLFTYGIKTMHILPMAKQSSILRNNRAVYLHACNSQYRINFIHLIF